MFAVIVGTAALGMIPASVHAQGAGVEKGMEVFVAQKCSVCHSIAGRGKKNAPLDDVGSRLTAVQIKEWILDPVAMAAKREPKSTRKPPMKKKSMPAGDVDALVAFLSGLKK
jgi:hypothetical protein